MTKKERDECKQLVQEAKQKSSTDSSGICGEGPTRPDADSTEMKKPLNKPQLRKDNKIIFICHKDRK